MSKKNYLLITMIQRDSDIEALGTAGRLAAHLNEFVDVKHGDRVILKVSPDGSVLIDLLREFDYFDLVKLDSRPAIPSVVAAPCVLDEPMMHGPEPYRWCATHNRLMMACEAAGSDEGGTCPDCGAESCCKEVGRWQEAIRNHLIQLGAPDSLIDGGGCDSGDPLDLTLTEINQAFNYFDEERDSQ